MKNIFIQIIKLYQFFSRYTPKVCRFYPTCSNYMIEALETHGVFKGLYLGTIRILKCNPFGTYGYDPVPKKENKNEK